MFDLFSPLFQSLKGVNKNYKFNNTNYKKVCVKLEKFGDFNDVVYEPEICALHTEKQPFC